jgi:hypothetical protein
MTGIYGQDWASYQSSQPDTSGLSFAFVKVTQGLSYVNPNWVTQRDHAKANGLVWGGYHYPNMGNSVQAEADYFLSQVAWQPGDLVVLDWEGYDKANTGVPRSTQAAYKDAWLRYVKSRLPNNRVGVYANIDYWRNVDTSSYSADFLWIATAGRNAGDPGISDPWLFHQYSEAGGLDRDYCHLATTADLRAWALGTQPQEDVMPTADEIANAVWSHTEAPGSGKPVRAGAAITWMDSVHAGQNTRLDALAKQVTDLTAKVGSLTTTGLTPDQITAIANAVADVQAKRLES